MRTTLEVNSEYYTFSKNGTTHLINKDLSLSFISIKKSDLVTENGKVRSKSESKGKSFPLLELTVNPIGSAIKNAKVVIYGDSIMGLLSQEMEETDKDYKVVAAYDSKSNTWVSNGEKLTEVMEELELEVPETV